MPETSARNSVDAIVDLYKRDLDASLIEANLRLTLDERFAYLQALLEFADQLRRAPHLPATRA
jgi:hypothetical protein